MKIIYLIVIGTCWVFSYVALLAQSQPNISTFRETYQLINPAATGYKTFGRSSNPQYRLAGGLIYSQQKVGERGDGFDQQYAWGEYLFNVGNVDFSSGLNLAREKAGLLTHYAGTVNFGASRNLAKDMERFRRLSIGVGWTAGQNNLDADLSDFVDQREVSIFNNVNNVSYGNLNVGVFFYTPRMNIGLSLTKLSGSTSNFYDREPVTPDTITLNRGFLNVLAGYTFLEQEKFSLEWSIWGRFYHDWDFDKDSKTNGLPASSGLSSNIRLRSDPDFWLGFWLGAGYNTSFKRNSSLTIDAGLNSFGGFENLKIGGAFTLFLGQLRGIIQSPFEIQIAYVPL